MLVEYMQLAGTLGLPIVLSLLFVWWGKAEKDCAMMRVSELDRFIREKLITVIVQNNELMTALTLQVKELAVMLDKHNERHN